jgi:CDP-6-deoxy-D-xylo-4-hexulose-3-dehydrase
VGETKAKGLIRYGGIIAGQEEIDAVTGVLRGQQWSAGKLTAEFEAEFASYVGQPHGVMCNSGTSALLLALSCLPPGSRVVMPALQFLTLYSAALWCRLEPVLLDIDPDTLNLSPDALGDWLDAGNTADAVAFVHVAGNPAGIARIKYMCTQRRMILIEDCCEALGSTSKGYQAGWFGDLAAFSTHSAHHIAPGEGGMLLARNPEHAARARRIRDWGRDMTQGYDGYTWLDAGLNLRPTDIAAALGLAQMKRLGGFIKARRANAQHIAEGLTGLPCEVPAARHGDEPAWYCRPVLTDDRDDFIKAMTAAGVETRRLLCGNVARQPVASGAGSPDAWPAADDAYHRGLWLPVHPLLTPDDLDVITGTARQFWQGRR